MKKMEDKQNRGKIKYAQEIVSALLESKLSESLKNDIRDWLAAGSHTEEVDGALAKAFGELIEPDYVCDSESMRRFEQLAEKLGLDSLPAVKAKPAGRKLLLRRVMRVAAVLIPAIVIFGVALVRLRDGAVVEDAPQSKVIAAVGYDHQETLPDGTKVVLRENGSFEYMEDMSSERAVSLAGSADFSVTRTQDSLPFEVRTKNVTVTVLGTEFTVEERGDSTIVELYSGLVKVDSDVGEYYMACGERVTHIKGYGELIVERMAVDEVVERGFVPTLLMDKVPLREIIKAIEANYGVVFEFPQESAMNDTMSVDFEDEELQKIFEVLEKANPKYRYIQKDDRIIIRYTH